MSLQKMGFEVSFLKSELDFGIPYSAIKKAMGGWVEKEHCETGFQIHMWSLRFSFAGKSKLIGQYE